MNFSGQKMKNTTLRTMLMFLGFSVVMSTWADTEVVDGITWTYTVSDGKASVGGGSYYSSTAIPTSSTGDITIPSVLGGCPVTSIGVFAFRGCSRLTSVKIPSSVIIIVSQAFYGCSGLTSVTIPSSVTNIGTLAFEDCSGLVSFNVDAGNPNYKSVNGLLLTKDGMTLIAGVNGDVTIPEGVTSIGEYAFDGCSGLTSVTIPSSVTNIEACAFLDCSGLTGDVTIPKGVTSICEGVFQGCSKLTSVKIPSSVIIIVSQAFYGCSGLTSVTIPTNVTEIGIWAFGGCSRLTSVTIPSSVTNIGVVAFADCCRLLSFNVDAGNPNYKSVNGLLLTKDGMTLIAGVNGDVTIPEGVTSIGDSAFYGCSGLTSVKIPSIVTNIGPLAFSGCSGLMNVRFGGNAPTSFAFSRVASGCTATVYAGTTGWDDDGDGYWQGLKLVYVTPSPIPEGAVTVTGWSGKYDAQPHGITVTTKDIDNPAISYALDAAGPFGAENPTFVTVTNQTVWCVVAADGYETQTNSAAVVISQGDIGGGGEGGGDEPGQGEIPIGGLSKFDAIYVYDGEGHTINTQALYAVTLAGATPSFSFSLESNGVYQTSPFVYTNGGEYVCWYKIEAPNYKPFVHQAKLKIVQQVEITNITAQQRYPWNGLVDLSFTITGNSGMTYDTSFSVKDISGGTNLLMQTLMDANGSVLSLTNSLAPGPYKWIWNAAKDLPSGFVCDRLIVNANIADRSLPSVTDGLIHYWPLNGVLNDVCNVGYRLTGTEPEWIMDKNGNDNNAAYLSGENILTQDGNNIVEDNFTISCWVKPEFVLSMPSWIGINLGPGHFGIDNRAFPILLLPASGTSDCSGVGFSVASDRIDVQAFASAAAGWEGDPCIILDAAVDLSSGWHHVAVAFSSGKAPVLYIDGVVKSASSVALGGRYYLSSKLSVGGGAFAYSSKYKGGLSELGIYNRALFADEVQRIYNESK